MPFDSIYHVRYLESANYRIHAVLKTEEVMSQRHRLLKTEVINDIIYVTFLHLYWNSVETIEFRLLK